MSWKSNAASLPLWLVASLQLLPAHAQGQAAAPASATAPSARSDPADPNAPVAPAPYRSALGGYRAFSETPVAPWRETNDVVRARGGWRAYAREAAGPDAAPPSRPAASEPPAAPKPAASGHPAHPMK